MRIVKVILAVSFLTLSIAIVVTYYALLQKGQTLRFERESLQLMANKLKDIERYNNQWVRNVHLEINQIKAQRSKMAQDAYRAGEKLKEAEQQISEFRYRISKLENEYADCLTMFAKLYGAQSMPGGREKALKFMKELESLMKRGNSTTNAMLRWTGMPPSVEHFVEMPTVSSTINQSLPVSH